MVYCEVAQGDQGFRFIQGGKDVRYTSGPFEKAGSSSPTKVRCGEEKPVYLVLTMDDSTGLLSLLVAIPLRQFELDDSLSYVVLLGASRTALAKLPVYVGDQSHRSVTSHLS
jgi:hypothetical protein